MQFLSNLLYFLGLLVVFYGNAIAQLPNLKGSMPIHYLGEQQGQNIQVQYDTLAWGKEWQICMTHYTLPHLAQQSVVWQLLSTEATNLRMPQQKLKGRVYAYQLQQLGKQKALFLYHHEGLSHTLNHQLIYYIQAPDGIHTDYIELLNEEELIDLDQDGIPELLHTDYQFYNLPIQNCQVNLTNLQDLLQLGNYKPQLAPKIYKIKDNHFRLAKGKQYEQCLRAYLQKLEQELISLLNLEAEEGIEVMHFVHYFYICALINEKTRAWQFLKQNNKKMRYTCYEEGYEHLIETNIFDFITQYQNLITAIPSHYQE